MSAFNYVFHIHPYISFYLTYLSNLCQSNLPSFKRIHNLKAHFGSGSGSHRFASLCIGSLEAPEDRTEKDSKLCSAWNWTAHAQSAVGSAVVGAEDPRRKRNFQLRNSSILTRYRQIPLPCHVTEKGTWHMSIGGESFTPENEELWMLTQTTSCIHSPASGPEGQQDRPKSR